MRQSRRKWICYRAVVLLIVLALAARAGAQRVITSQYDNARTGANLNETNLTPRNVNVQHFGKLFTFVPARDADCPFISPEIGITSTPVIDPDTGTLYVLARTRDRSGFLENTYAQRLHALAVNTGVEKFGGPVAIHAGMSGKGTGSRGGKLDFNPLRDNPRAALLLNRGAVYLAWASACDVGPYHGWVMAYDARSLKQKVVFNASPDADDSGIWEGDTGPAADKAGNIFLARGRRCLCPTALPRRRGDSRQRAPRCTLCRHRARQRLCLRRLRQSEYSSLAGELPQRRFHHATGNGRFDAGKGGRDYGDSLLKLDGASLKLSDYFAPYNVNELDTGDSDLGSGGPVLLPDQSGGHPHLAVVEGKGGILYLVDRDHMGHWQAGNNSHAVQTIAVGNGVNGSMSYWNHYIYVLADSDALRQFEVKDGSLSLKAASGNTFRRVSATPTVSANGSRDGIVWLLRWQGWGSSERPAVLYAYDAADVARELYDSGQNPGRDRAGLSLRFNIPIVVNGHVYVGTKHEVDVYGLLPVR
jgi:hypothetical protein